MQHWSKREHPEGECWPVGRAYHAAVCLGYGGDHPQLLVTGGALVKVLSDAWLLDIKSSKWREVRTQLMTSHTSCHAKSCISIAIVYVQVSVPKLQGRCHHSATAFSLSSGLTEVTLFGGCPEWISDALPRIAATTVLRFGM